MAIRTGIFDDPIERDGVLQPPPLIRSVMRRTPEIVDPDVPPDPPDPPDPPPDPPTTRYWKLQIYAFNRLFSLDRDNTTATEKTTRLSGDWDRYWGTAAGLDVVVYVKQGDEPGVVVRITNGYADFTSGLYDWLRFELSPFQSQGRGLYEISEQPGGDKHILRQRAAFSFTVEEYDITPLPGAKPNWLDAMAASELAASLAAPQMLTAYPWGMNSAEDGVMCGPYYIYHAIAEGGASAPGGFELGYHRHWITRSVDGVKLTKRWAEGNDIRELVNFMDPVDGSPKKYNVTFPMGWYGAARNVDGEYGWDILNPSNPFANAGATVDGYNLYPLNGECSYAYRLFQMLSHEGSHRWRGFANWWNIRHWDPRADEALDNLMNATRMADNLEPNGSNIYSGYLYQDIDTRVQVSTDQLGAGAEWMGRNWAHAMRIYALLGTSGEKAALKAILLQYVTSYGICYGSKSLYADVSNRPCYPSTLGPNPFEPGHYYKIAQYREPSFLAQTFPLLDMQSEQDDYKANVEPWPLHTYQIADLTKGTTLSAYSLSPDCGVPWEPGLDQQCCNPRDQYGPWYTHAFGTVGDRGPYYGSVVGQNDSADSLVDHGGSPGTWPLSAHILSQMPDLMWSDATDITVVPGTEPDPFVR